MDDYQTDNRGDVGSWVREAAMESALPLLALGCAPTEAEAAAAEAEVEAEAARAEAAKAAVEDANAEAEVRRSFTTSYPPLYQLAYMMGGLQFYALRNEMMAQGWTEKQFHDRVMVEGRMPVELLRSLLQELPLSKNYKTKWKFSTDFKD